ncbi:alpha-amylase family glycosyl hydrolase [Anaerobacillus alkaliphilus]|uniref:alpha-amylase family glycosyl hydrolase n=1 Tax=Anaerobacillus alkaliphilus TaxID=1548597 RepID=UPI001F4F279F|nr:alpha-amylase family glycosyl hydrolase [Anaerobacillus alkaliphilus]
MKIFSRALLFSFLLSFGIIVGCTTPQEPKQHEGTTEAIQQEDLISSYPNTVFYEIFVRAFYDSTGDGIGDINGMTSKLDYLQDLGVEGIWLMPIHPSPSYHGYDVTDYYDVHPEYGTMEDFKTFMEEAHKRDIKVIIDLVVNHSSIEHPYFQDAITSEDSSYRDWYIWADEEANLRERGEWGQPFWHGEAPNNYFSVFWGGMPDFNFYNPEVRQEMINIGRYWLEEVGVDGFRLDAAKHIFPKDKDQNLVWWKEFRSAMEAVNPDVFLVGEVWDLPQVAGPYLEDGLHSTFNFDLAEEILRATRSERAGSLVPKLIRSLQTFERYASDFVDSTFITNHDMNRVMSELRGNTDQAKIAASLLLTLPGSPFIYYGEEIGMEGAKPDEHIREPMLWYENGGDGQTAWIKPKHNIGTEAPSVEAQLEDPNSLLNHYKTMIYLRRSQPALLFGDIVESNVKEQGALTYIRTHNDEELHVFHNLSKGELEISLGELAGNVIFTSTTEYSLTDGMLKLPAYSTIILATN